MGSSLMPTKIASKMHRTKVMMMIAPLLSKRRRSVKETTRLRANWVTKWSPARSTCVPLWNKGSNRFQMRTTLSSDHVSGIEAVVAKGDIDEASVGARPEYEGSREYKATIPLRIIRIVKKRLLHHRRPRR